MRYLFEFYGVTVSIESDAMSVLDELRDDFAFFRIHDAPEPKADISLELVLEEPRISEHLRGKRLVFRTSNNSSHREGRIRYVDHRGRALGIYDFDLDWGRVVAADPRTLYDVAYVLLLTRVGDRLDERGIHRIHALGVVYEGQGILFPGPSGAGKSMLGLELLNDRRIEWLSDEIPLLDDQLQALPFPMPPRLEAGTKIPWRESGVLSREVWRIKEPPKIKIDPHLLLPRVAKPSPLTALLLPVRVGGGTPRIRPVGPFEAIGAIARYLWLGFDLPHTKAYFLRIDARSLVRHVRVMQKRSRVMVRLLRDLPIHRLELSDDLARNRQILMEFLEGMCTAPGRHLESAASPRIKESECPGS